MRRMVPIIPLIEITEVPVRNRECNAIENRRCRNLVYRRTIMRNWLSPVGGRGQNPWGGLQCADTAPRQLIARLGFMNQQMHSSFPRPVARDRYLRRHLRSVIQGDPGQEVGLCIGFYGGLYDQHCVITPFHVCTYAMRMPGVAITRRRKDAKAEAGVNAPVTFPTGVLATSTDQANPAPRASMRWLSDG